MKGRREYGYGYGSSRTSFEDEADPPPPPRKVMGPERGGRWLSQRERAAANMPESEYGTFTELRLWVAAACLMHCIFIFFRRNGRWKRVVARPARLWLVALVARRNGCEHLDYKCVKGMGV